MVVMMIRRGERMKMLSLVMLRVDVVKWMVGDMQVLSLVQVKVQEQRGQ